MKGGNVLGLKVLKLIYDKFKDDDEKFKKVFTNFLELDLIKDWDFSAYTDKPITPEYRRKLDKIAKGYNLYQRASTFCLYQTGKPILLEGKPLFEISVLDSDTFSNLEIPLTTMKIKVTEFNLKYVFMFCKSFYAYKQKGEPFDFDILKRLLSKISVIIYPHKNGLYDVNNNFDNGQLNTKLINFIKSFEDFDKNLPQFLATHIEDPYRILYRLVEKNIHKNDKIKKFLESELNIKNELWLLESKWIYKIIDEFCKKLGDELVKIYKEEYVKTMDVKKSFIKVDEFLNGISFNRIMNDFNMLGDVGKKLLGLIFNNLMNELGKENIVNIENNSQIFKFIKFLSNKK